MTQNVSILVTIMGDKFEKEQKKETPTKERHRFKLIDYLSNLENEWPGRSSFGPIILGITDRALRKHFSPYELNDIEYEALELRRKQYSRLFVKADKALAEQIEKGDTQAIKLMYQRFEGWSEKQRHELTLLQRMSDEELDEKIATLLNEGGEE